MTFEQKINDVKQSFNDIAELLNKWNSNPVSFHLIQEAGELLTKSILNGGKVLCCGNGGSMCDAMHFAEELTGRFRQNRKALPAIALADISHATCVANDFGFDYIFSRGVEALGNEKDVLIAISTSGNSANIINAVSKAHEIGMKVISLTGKNGGKLAEMSDIELRIDWMGYSDRIQEIHMIILHTLVQYIEAGTT